MLTIPTVQSVFHLMDEAPLNGAIKVEKDTLKFSIVNWFSGEYAKNKEYMYENSFGFKNTCIRLHNQMYYSLFKKAKANGVIIGKDNCLYELNYINAYLGKDYIGYNKSDSLFRRIKIIDDYCNMNNKKLVLIFAPGKASFYPEFIPDKYFNSSVDLKNTNYNSFIDLSNKYKLNYIDFNNYLMKNKKTSTHKLYSKSGIHWSQYASVKCADSAIKYFENLLKIDLNNIVINSIEKKEVDGTDKDVIDGMNLLWPPKEYNLSYPNFGYNKGLDNGSKNAIIVADSYYWQWNNFGFYGLFKNCSFYYYNNQNFEPNKEPQYVSQIDFNKKIQETDLVVILATEANLSKFSWGFVDDFYNKVINPSIKENYVDRKKLNEWKKIILSSPAWVEGLKKESKNNNISLDSAITMAAYYELSKQK
ncbi:MAG: hypothetical protein JNM51_12355 [Bacteroidia bacterium]|nr:hypothetical protein [Bacteroidia bacterium]